MLDVVLVLTGLDLFVVNADVKSSGFCNIFPMKPYSKPTVSDPNPNSDKEKSKS